MRISHEYRFVFLAVPRTGSTSIREILTPYSDIESINKKKISHKFPFYHHITASELNTIFERYGWEWDAYRKFCTVRNPWDRLVSVYHHLAKIKSGHGPEAGWARNSANFVKSKIQPLPSFLEFVKGLHGEGVSNFGNGGQMASPLTTFIEDDAGHTLVDDIIKFEELNDVLPGYLKQLGIEEGIDSIPHTNQSDRRPYQEYYDEEAKDMVHHIYRYEIERFGYSFE